MASNHRPFSEVLIAGAGPAGLLLALLLAQHGIPSTVLEAWDKLDQRLRATQYGVPATRIFRRAGILEDIRADSIESFPYICWRRVSDHQRITGIDLSTVKDHPDRMTIMPLRDIIEIMYKHCTEKYGDLVSIKFNHEVVGVGQDAEKAWADVKIKDQDEQSRFEADYLIGCDGSRSAVRHNLFGRNWPGITHDCHLLVQNIWYDGFEKHGWDGGNYMIGSDTWGLVARRARGGLWRCTYGDNEPGLTDEEYEARRPAAMKKMLPGRPSPDQYRITQTDHFRIHNRCVEQMRVGRILLAADAAHVNNPFGGYGAMCAILDVGGLADCMIGLYDGKAGDEILDLYAEIRRDKFLKYVDARSMKNMRRIINDDPHTNLDDDKLMNIMRELEGNSEGTKEFLLVSLPSSINSRTDTFVQKYSSIEYDFTQHYRQQ
jgi:2-polyprenyl-6-methoxyphenol hydroxylase-like FAD-dependent oxidoreductase